jgi:hypothetical protein
MADSATVTLSGGGDVVLAPGGSDEVSGNNGPAGNTLVNVDNTISGVGQIGGGYNQLTLDNQAAGVVAAVGGELVLGGPVSGSGTLAAGAGAVLDLATTSALYAADTLEPSAGGIIAIGAAITSTTAPSSIIAGVESGGTIAFSNQLDGTSSVVNGNTLMVGVTIDGSDVQFPLTFATDAGAAQATVSGNDVIVACFAAGTSVLTAQGEVAVEDLVVGENVVTLAGGQPGLRRIAWLGHRRVDCAQHPRPQEVWPVRIRRGAFGPGLPHRDLLLSPDHAVAVRDAARQWALVPVRHLVNGATIAQEAVDSVTYWHVELPRHDVLLADGLPCESYLDTGNRGAFANGGTAVALQPDFALRRWDAEACAPLLQGGPRLADLRRRLLDVAATLGSVLVDVPDLRVIVDGTPVALKRDGARWRCRLPRGARVARLVSRRFVPAQVAPDENDARVLGVALAGLTLDGRPALPLAGGGWHAAETGADWCWTDGDATLDVAGARELCFELVMTGRYWQTAMARRRSA